MMKSLGSVLPEPQQSKCATHGEFSAVPMGGRVVCPKCHAELEKAKTAAQNEVAEKRRLAGLRSLVYHSGVPPRFQSKTFDTFEAADERQTRVLRVCRAYADRFDERHAAGGGLVMCGKVGTGKTHLACSIANQIMAAGRSALFIPVLAAVRRVKQTYAKGSTETEQDAIGKFFVPDLLIVDEVGVQLGTATEHNILFEIINGRYERVLPTILLSNLTELEMEQTIGERVMDRMKEGGGVVLAFDWPSKRKDVKTASRDLPVWAQGK